MRTCRRGGIGRVIVASMLIVGAGCSGAGLDDRSAAEDADDVTGADTDRDRPDTPGTVDPADHVVADVVPESSASEPSGNFRFLCEMSHLSYDDPIVSPGEPGAAHLHMFFGNETADAWSTYESLRERGAGTCQGGPLNRSGYWIPAVIDGDDRVVVPEYITVYYKGPGTAADGSIVDVEAFPAGLRMIAGEDLDRPGADSRHEWYCEVNQVKSPRLPECAPDELVGVSLAFPTCWNGTDLDAPDHRSHMAYVVYHPETGIPSCPPSHPVRLPEFTLGVWFAHDGDSADWHLSSDRMDDHTMSGNGASFHADWFGAWDPRIQQIWIDECINGLLDCAGGQLGDGTRLSDTADVSTARIPVPER